MPLFFIPKLLLSSFTQLQYLWTVLKKIISTPGSEDFLCLGLYHELQRPMQKVGYKNNLRNNYIFGITRQFSKVTVLRPLVHFIRPLCGSYSMVIDLKKKQRSINTVLTLVNINTSGFSFCKTPLVDNV